MEWVPPHEEIPYFLGMSEHYHLSWLAVFGTQITSYTGLLHHMGHFEV